MLKLATRIFLVILGAFLSFPYFGAAQNSPYVPGELLIAPKAGVSDADLENQYKAHGGQKIKTLPQIRVHHIKVPAHALEKIEAALTKNPKVEFVEKNFLAEPNMVPIDPLYTSQWHLQRISAPSGWDIAIGSSNIVIAVLDTGIDTNHPDLTNKVAGKNFVDGTNNVEDTGAKAGHGTAASGVAAAAGNNGIGVSGVSWKNSIMPLVVVNPSTGSAAYSTIASAINYAADNGANVISMSLAGSSYSSTLQSAANYAWNKGAVMIASAGNNSSSTPMYPAALDNVVAVSATDNDDNPASFSNFGNWIDVAAPGTYIYTTDVGSGYGAWQGTSFSAPQVAGLAGLLLAANPKLTNAQIVDIIKKNADDLGSLGFDQYYGFGRINVYRSLLAAASAPSLSASISSPANGSTVSGVVTVSVNVSSTYAITKVELYVDNYLYASDTASPYSFSFDTSQLSGTHTLLAKGYDSIGNVAISSTVSINVDNTLITTDTTPPEIQITGILYDGKNITVAAAASDPGGNVTKVEFYVNGSLKATDISAPWSAKINAKPLGKGNQEIKAKAYDAAGNTSFSTSATVATTR